MVLAVALALVLGIDILRLQSFSKGGYLLLEAIFGHHQGEIKASLALLLPAVEHVEDNSTAESDDGGTLAIGVLHVVDVLGSLHALLFHPIFDGLSEPWRVDKTRVRAQPCDSLLNASLILSGTTAKLGHLLERRVGHLGHENTRGETVLDVVLLEALAHSSVRS